MLETLELLKKSRIIKKFEVIDFKHGKDFYYIKIKAEVIDGSVLAIREYVSEQDFLYSYHWQDFKGNLLMRWDNAPHFKNIKTYPHHKHLTNGTVLESYEVNLKDVLKFIESKLISPKN